MTWEPHSHVSEQEAGEANSYAGSMVLDVPSGVAVAMTPDAADATLNTLYKAAEAARSQGGNLV